MKTRQLELKAIPQFDSGRWKLRLERVPVEPDNETTIGIDFDSAQARINETNEANWFLYLSNAADANDKPPVERIGMRQLTPGLISSLLVTARLPPFISFSTSCADAEIPMRPIVWSPVKP